jgi:hypothetical protein
MWRLLVLHLTPRPRAVRLTTEQHLAAVTAVPDAEILSFNAVHGPPAWLRHLRFDAVILYTTFLSARWSPWFELWKQRGEWLSDLDALKIALPQDEYDHAHVLDDWLDELGVSVIGTVLDDTYRQELYPRLSQKAAFYDVLTGYVDDAAAERLKSRSRPPEQRPVDIVYRARHPPYWHGSHGQLKYRVGEVAAELASQHGLATDISTRSQETVLGDAWLDFLARGRATVGVESGVSVLDRRGEIQERMRDLLHDDPTLTFEQASTAMPAGWDDYRFFAISPRHFEAVVTKTAQILVEGSYSGVLEPNRHFIPVRRDLSDMDEALEQLRDVHLTGQLTEQAYEDLYSSGRYSGRRLTEAIERMLAEHAGPPLTRSRFLLAAAAPVAAAEASAERIVVEPFANVVRVGRDGYGEILAGMRLLAAEPALRRLLVDYMRSSATREYVSPRQALADLLCLGVMRRAQKGKAAAGSPFAINVELEQEQRRIVLRSQPPGGNVPSGLTPERLRGVLKDGVWEFVWDHSAIGPTATFRITSSRSVELPLRGGNRTLTLLNWLAGERPRHVASAIAPLLVTRS